MTELPPELARRVERQLARFDRGTVTLDELENDLLEAVHSFAGREYEQAHPDWTRDGLFDRTAWEIGFEAKRQAEAEVGASYALAAAAAYEHASGLVEWVFQSPQWHQALEPATARLTEAAAGGPESIGAVASLAWAASWRGVLPPEMREAVRGATLDDGASMIDLLESDREGDAPRVAEIVAESGQRGCVSPAIHLLRRRRDARRPVAASQISALVDLDDLANRGEFGGITHMAVELLADGADADALVWSSAVDESLLFRAPAERPTNYSGWEPYRAYDLDRRQRDHGPGTCVRLCNCGDARLLGALAVVDWIAGNERRAQERAVACDRGADPQGWSASGMDLLAEWVMSRRLEPTEMADALLSMIKHADGSHVDLGLLGVQIHGELAELLEVAGDSEAAARHRTRMNWFEARPEMRLHFESFQFPSLLTCFPLIPTPTN